jgi:hypothetical protein
MPHKTVILNGTYQPQTNKVLKPSWDWVCDEWPNQPPNDHLNIFVCMPVVPDIIDSAGP